MAILCAFPFVRRTRLDDICIYNIIILTSVYNKLAQDLLIYRSPKRHKNAIARATRSNAERTNSRDSGTLYRKNTRRARTPPGVS